jgi:hypothetical protein
VSYRPRLPASGLPPGTAQSPSTAGPADHREGLVMLHRTVRRLVSRMLQLRSHDGAAIASMDPSSPHTGKTRHGSAAERQRPRFAGTGDTIIPVPPPRRYVSGVDSGDAAGLDRRDAATATPIAVTSRGVRPPPPRQRRSGRETTCSRTFGNRLPCSHGHQH